jgi:hypothetical protein
MWTSKADILTDFCAGSRADPRIDNRHAAMSAASWRDTMKGASDLANWWDGQRKESEETLEQWVQDNPQWWAIGVATATATAMDLGGGMVDALRFGEGMAEGGVKGFAKDAMRMLVVVGPVARGVGTVGRLAHTQMIRLAVKTKGVTGPCTFTAVNNALTIVGGKARNVFLTVRDAAAALKRPMAQVAKVDGKYKMSAWIDDLIPFLVRSKVGIKNLGQPKAIADVVNAARTNNGVVIFAIKWTDTAGKLHKHSMIAVKTVGGVKFADYGGKFISNLSELAKRGGIWVTNGAPHEIYTTTTKGSALLVKGMEVIGVLDNYAAQVFNGGMLLLEGMTAIESAEGVEIAFPIETAAAIESSAHEPEVIQASLEAFKARQENKPLKKLPPIKIRGRKNGPPRPDWLTGVQYRLNAAGFGAGPVDGIMGPKTLKAVRAFQETYKLDVDGIPGPITQGKLVEVCGF